MASKRIYYFLIVFLLSITVYAQEQEANYFSFKQLNTNPSHFIQNLNVDFSATENSETNSNIISQNGVNNVVDLKNSTYDVHNILQEGKNNHFQYINYYNSTPSLLNIQQQGNSNLLQIYGKNSIIERITVIQKANFKSLIIKNY